MDMDDAQVEGGNDPDDLEELEDAQSLAKVVGLFTHNFSVLTMIQMLFIFCWTLCIYLSYPAQVIKRRMAVDWAAEM